MENQFPGLHFSFLFLAFDLLVLVHSLWVGLFCISGPHGMKASVKTVLLPGRLWAISSIVVWNLHSLPAAHRCFCKMRWGGGYFWQARLTARLKSLPRVEEHFIFKLHVLWMSGFKTPLTFLSQVKNIFTLKSAKQTIFLPASATFCVTFKWIITCKMMIVIMVNIEL